MASASDFIGGLPVGDKLRFGSVTNIPATTSNITILNFTGKGILHGVYIFWSGATISITNIKVTIDGAAERTFSTSGAITNASASAPSSFLPLPIAFKTSLVLKFDNGSGGTCDCQAMYTVR